MYRGHMMDIFKDCGLCGKDNLQLGDRYIVYDRRIRNRIAGMKVCHNCFYQYGYDKKETRKLKQRSYYWRKKKGNDDGFEGRD